MREVAGVECLGPAARPTGLVLGPLAELQFRRALAISEGNVAVFVTHPISAVLIGIAVIVLLAPWLLRRLSPNALEATG